MKSDYDTDFYEWTQHQAAALAAGHFSELDLVNLAEEIESLGRSDRRGVRNNLKIVLLHLLKWHYQPEMRETGQSWANSIIEHRDRIQVLLDESPSLRRQVEDLMANAYPVARRMARNETGLPMATFPETCPWTAEQVLDDEFWPGE